MLFGSKHRQKICEHQAPNSGEAIIRLWVIWPMCTHSIFKCCNMNYCTCPFFYSWNGRRGLMYCNTFSCHRQCSSRKCDLLTSYTHLWDKSQLVSELWHALLWEKLPNKLRWDRRQRGLACKTGKLRVGLAAAPFPPLASITYLKWYPDLVSFARRRATNFNWRTSLNLVDFAPKLWLASMLGANDHNHILP